MTFVYFIKPIGHEGPIKIGQAQDPSRRFQDLDQWAPWPLELLATIEGDRHLERRFHHYFRDLHQRREWFRVSNELQAVVREVAEGTFDTSILPEPRNLPRRPRDNSYATKAWGYRRSVIARLDFIRRKHGLVDASKFSQHLDVHLGKDDPFRWPLHKAEIEQHIEMLRQEAERAA